MKSSFFEYNVASSGLQVARAGLNITSNNVANASNKGYSRQYIEQRAARPLTYFNGRGMFGTGADVYGVGQIRSAYLDKKYWHENSIRGEHSLKMSQLSSMETILSGMSDSGLNGLFDGFFMSIEDLTQNAGNATYRTNVITNAQTLSKQINATVESLKKQQQDINAEVASMVQVVNSLGNQIASLNKQISSFEIDGSRANDLRDQRTRLIDRLSQYVNVEVREDERNEEYALGMWPEPEDRGKSDKRLIVLINGEEFVNHTMVTGLRVVERTEKLSPSDAPGLYDIYFNSSNKKFDLFSPTLTGELKAMIDVRDGNNTYYMNGSVKSYIKSTGELKISCTGKLDVGNAGYIELTDPTTHSRTQYRYDSFGEHNIKYDVDASGNITGATIRIKEEDRTPYLEQIAKIGTKLTIGRSTPYKGIPHYINKLNELVRTFAKAFNEGANGNAGHVDGYNAYNGTGNLFFTYDTFHPDYDASSENRIQTKGSIDNYLYMKAESFMVNPELIKDPLLLAASESSPADESDNRLLLQLLELKDFRGLFKEGKLSDYMQGMASELGIDMKQAKQFDNNYTEVVTYVDNQRESVSGVNLDEEMADMMRFQHLYQAAAKLLNVIDSIYDTCINRLGNM